MLTTLSYAGQLRGETQLSVLLLFTIQPPTIPSTGASFVCTRCKAQQLKRTLFFQRKHNYDEKNRLVNNFFFSIGTKLEIQETI